MDSMSISAMTAPWLNTFFSAQLPALGAAPFYVNVSKVIIKRCTPLGSKCTPHRPFVKWYRGVKQKRLHGDHFRTTVAPVIVKKYRKTLVNGGFCKKKLDTHSDTQMYQNWCPVMVELRGIEPLSESNLTGLSPGAVCYLHSLGAAGTDTLRTLVAS